MISVPPMVECSSDTSENSRRLYFVALYPCSSHCWSAQGTPRIALINLVERILALNLQCALQGKSAFTLSVLLSISSQNLKKGGKEALLPEKEQFSCFTSAYWVSLWKLLPKCLTLVDFHFSFSHPVNKASMTIFHVLACFRVSRQGTCLYTLKITLVIQEYYISTKP